MKNQNLLKKKEQLIIIANKLANESWLNNFSAQMDMPRVEVLNQTERNLLIELVKNEIEEINNYLKQESL